MNLDETAALASQDSPLVAAWRGLFLFMLICFIIESVDSICRDNADT